MAQVIQLFVDNTSPTISYSPYDGSYMTPNLTAGWNPFFDGSGFLTAPGEIGSGTSYHATSRNNASLSVTWRGTGIQLLGFVNNSAYDIHLDGTTIISINAELKNGVLATIQNLSERVHTASLTSRIPVTSSNFQSMLYFDKALLFSAVDATTNTLFVERPVEQYNIFFAGQWSFTNDSGIDIHYSKATGDIARTQFAGATFSLSGSISPTSGDYSVILDNVKTTLSAYSSFTQKNTVLFFATGLDPNIFHEIKVINEDGGDLRLNSNGFKVFTDKPLVPSVSSFEPLKEALPKGYIAAMVLGALLTFILLSALLCAAFVPHPRKHANHIRSPAPKKEEEIERFFGGIGVDGEGETRIIVGPDSSIGSYFTPRAYELENGSSTGAVEALSSGNIPSVRRTASSLTWSSYTHDQTRDSSSSQGSPFPPSFRSPLPSLERRRSESDGQDISRETCFTDNISPTLSRFSSFSYISVPVPLSQLPPINAAFRHSAPRSVSRFTPSLQSPHLRSWTEEPGLRSEGGRVTSGVQLHPREQRLSFLTQTSTDGNAEMTHTVSEETTSSSHTVSTTCIAICNSNPRVSESVVPSSPPVRLLAVPIARSRRVSATSCERSMMSMHQHPAELLDLGQTIRGALTSFLDVPSPGSLCFPELFLESALGTQGEQKAEPVPNQGRTSFIDVSSSHPVQGSTLDHGSTDRPTPSEERGDYGVQLLGATKHPPMKKTESEKYSYINLINFPDVSRCQTRSSSPTENSHLGDESGSVRHLTALALDSNLGSLIHSEDSLSCGITNDKLTSPLPSSLELHNVVTKPPLPRIVLPPPCHFSMCSPSQTENPSYVTSSSEAQSMQGSPSSIDSVNPLSHSDILFRRTSEMNDPSSDVVTSSSPLLSCSRPSSSSGSQIHSVNATPGHSPSASLIVQCVLGRNPARLMS